MDCTHGKDHAISRKIKGKSKKKKKKKKMEDKLVLLKFKIGYLLHCRKFSVVKFYCSILISSIVQLTFGNNLHEESLK